MKIEKVIFTIDDNPHYKGFWSSISRHFLEKFNINPVLYVICENEKNIENSYDKKYGDVRFIKKLDSIPTIIQSLIGKFYFTKYEPETTWIIGDLDLYPLQHYHFKNRILDIDELSYVHLNPHAYGVDWRNKHEGLAGYFHVAKGKIFQKELLFENKTFEDVCLEIYNSNKFGVKFYKISPSKDNLNASKDWGWFCSEEMYTGNILKNSVNLIELPPQNGIYERIDRESSYDLNKLINGKYIDLHAPRPYENFSSHIENIISKVSNI